MSDDPDDILLPLGERLADWTDFDEAAFFLGKVLGIIPVGQSYSQSKHLFFYPKPGEAGMKLLDILGFLADIGILESRGGEFRWSASGGLAAR